MSTAPSFLTATMARLYMDQGRFSEAADIYRGLLARDPGRSDLAQALEDALGLALGQRRQALIGLFGRWFDLMAECNHLRRLNKLCRTIA